MAAVTTLTKPKLPTAPAPLATTVPTPSTVIGSTLGEGKITHGDPAPGNTGIVPPASTDPNPLAGALAGYTPSTPNGATNIGAVNGVDPVQVNPTSMSGYQPFIDSAYQQAASRLDPQWAQQQDRFDQQMVARGIPQGSEAYNKAWDDFSRAKNDAYSSAQANAFGQGLAAQGQAWGQGAQQAGLAQAMRQWADQFGLNRDQLDANIQNQLVGQQMDQFRLNQAGTLQQFQLAQALLGMTPGMAPAQIDTYSPYSLQQSSAQARAQQGQNASNGFWGALGQLGSAWLGGR